MEIKKVVKSNLHEVIIIGGGIAAHAAALYTARANLSPLIISAPEPDQLSLTNLVENYPGFPDGIMGPKLIEDSKKQAEKFGAKYITEWAKSLDVKKHLNRKKTKMLTEIKKEISKISKKIRKDIELHFFTEKEIKQNKKDPLIKDILKNGKKIL